MDVCITLSESGADRLHNELLANLFGESWAPFGTPFAFGQQSLRSIPNDIDARLARAIIAAGRN